MAIGWALKEMSEKQYRQILEQMNKGVKRNFKILDAVRDDLAADEDLLTFIEAQDGNSRASCLMALTDRRLVVAQKAWRGKFEIESIRFAELVYVGHRRTEWFGRLDVWQGKSERHFNSTDKEMMESFGQHVVERFDSWYKGSSHRIEMEHKGDPVQTDKSGASLNLDELERLAELWRSGALDESEFQKAKRRLLS